MEPSSSSSSATTLSSICSQGPQWPYFKAPLAEHVDKLQHLMKEFAEIKDNTSVKTNRRYDKLVSHQQRMFTAMERLLASGATMAIDKNALLLTIQKVTDANSPIVVALKGENTGEAGRMIQASRNVLQSNPPVTNQGATSSPAEEVEGNVLLTPYIVTEMGELSAKLQNFSVVLRKFNNTASVEEKPDIAASIKKLEARQKEQAALEERSIQLDASGRKALEELDEQRNTLAKSLALKTIFEAMNGWELKRENLCVKTLNNLQEFLSEVMEISEKRKTFQGELENIVDFAPKKQEIQDDLKPFITDYEKLHTRAKDVYGKDAEEQIKWLQERISEGSKELRESMASIKFYNPKTGEEVESELSRAIKAIDDEQTALLQELQEKWSDVQKKMNDLGDKIIRMDVWIKKGGGIKPIETFKNWWGVGWNPSVTPFFQKEEPKPEEEKEPEKVKKAEEKK